MLEFTKIIDEKRKLILDDKSFSHVGQGITLDTFKPIENELVLITEFNDDGTMLISRESRINIGKEIGKGEMNTYFQLSIDNDNNEPSHLIKISNSIVLSFNDIVNGILKLELASLYASLYNIPNIPHEVITNKPFIISFIQRTPILIGQGEPFIIGDYIKYNNNGTNNYKKVQRDISQTFSHFTLVVSNCQQLITDIQGFYNIYTDLQVHSLIDQDKYGKGNLGAKRIVEFTREHKCTNICKLLKIDDQFSNSTHNFGETLAMDENSIYQNIKSNELFRIGKRHLYNNNMIKAAEILKQSADLGNSTALNNLGVIYQFGNDSLQPDIKLAIEYYKKSADLGNSTSLFNLGVIYHNGKDSIESDIKLAIEYYKKSADLGNSNAFHNLGYIYHDGEDSIQCDIKLAIEYYKKSGELGDRNALYNLAAIYHDGQHSIQIDMKLAIKYYQKSADLGNSEALHCLRRLQNRKKIFLKTVSTKNEYDDTKSAK